MAAAPPLPKSFEEAARHHVAVEEELERVCGSSHFRSSRRSCEFLRYIVRVTLDGRMDSLKERSIGIDLFGRDTSYEPSSDATVRVRANEVRKRLSSYYASRDAAEELHSLRIDLPTGSYVPRFLSAPPASAIAASGHTALSGDSASSLAGSLSRSVASAAQVPPVQALTLMRPALLALLLCTLLLRHQLENREEYLRFWDRLLSGRSALVLSVAPQDRATLASSLYPLVWVAGRYGVDATMQGDSLTGIKPEALASVQVTYPTSTDTSDRRLRWALIQSSAAGPHGSGEPAASSEVPRLYALVDRHLPGAKVPVFKDLSSAALLTVVPEDPSTLRVQGTDAGAIRLLLEDLTVERNFPSGLAEHFNSRHTLQVVVYRDSSGNWQQDFFWGDA